MIFLDTSGAACMFLLAAFGGEGKIATNGTMMEREF